MSSAEYHGASQPSTPRAQLPTLEHKRDLICCLGRVGGAWTSVHENITPCIALERRGTLVCCCWWLVTLCFFMMRWEIRLFVARSQRAPDD
jgi:hypothetical protein